jgi:hypothetical protein
MKGEGGGERGGKKVFRTWKILNDWKGRKSSLVFFFASEQDKGEEEDGW